jgi:hypothetical protein
MGHQYITIAEVAADLEAIKSYLAHLQKERERRLFKLAYMLS